MCFGSKTPQISPAPVQTPPPEPAPAPPHEPAPAPSPSPSASSAMVDQEARRKKINDMARYGMRSTIKTSPQGIVTPDLAGSAKDKLGS